MMRSRMLSLMAAGAIGVGGVGMATALQQQEDPVQEPAQAEVPGEGQMETVSGHIVDLQTYLVHGYDEAIEAAEEADPFEQPLQEPADEPEQQEEVDPLEDPAEDPLDQESIEQQEQMHEQEEELEDPAAMPDRERTLAVVTEDDEAYVLIEADHEELGFAPPEEPAEEPEQPMDEPVDQFEDPAEQEPLQDPAEFDEQEEFIEDPAEDPAEFEQQEEEVIEDPAEIEQQQEEELEDPQQVVQQHHTFAIGDEMDLSGLVYEQGGVRGLIIGSYDLEDEEEAEEPVDPLLQ